MLLLTLLFACQTPSPPPAAFWEGHETLVVGAPESPACTLVAIHGYGTSPAGLKSLFSGLPTPVQVILPRGPIPRDRLGWAWFSRSREVSPGELATQITAQADLLTEGLSTLPTPAPIRGKPIITGFSQGGMLSWSVAIRHPDAIGGALPLSGYLPEPGLPTTPIQAVPIHAFHGRMDRVIPLDAATRTAEAVREQGGAVVLSTYPDTNHNVPEPVRRDYYAAIAELCAAQ